MTSATVHRRGDIAPHVQITFVFSGCLLVGVRVLWSVVGVEQHDRSAYPLGDATQQFEAEDTNAGVYLDGSGMPTIPNTC